MQVKRRKERRAGGESEREIEIRKAEEGVASRWKNSHFGTQKVLLRRNDYPRSKEKGALKERERKGNTKSRENVEQRRKVRMQTEREGDDERRRRRAGESAHGKAR